MKIAIQNEHVLNYNTNERNYRKKCVHRLNGAVENMWKTNGKFIYY